MCDGVRGRWSVSTQQCELEQANTGAEVEPAGRGNADVVFNNMVSAHDNGNILEPDR